MNPIERAAEAVGGLTKLASLLGVSIQVVCNWRDRKKVPVSRCRAIEDATGGAVTRRDLRPDDWQQIWPEMDQPTSRKRIVGQLTQQPAAKAALDEDLSRSIDNSSKG